METTSSGIKMTNKCDKMSQSLFVVLNKLKKRDINLKLLILDRMKLVNYIKNICKNRFIIRKSMIVCTKRGQFKIIIKYKLVNLNIMHQISQLKRRKKLKKIKWRCCVAAKRQIRICSPTIRKKTVIKPIVDPSAPINVRDKIKEQLLLLHMGKQPIDIANVSDDLIIFDDNREIIVEKCDETQQAVALLQEKVLTEKQNGEPVEIVETNDQIDCDETLLQSDDNTCEIVLENSNCSETSTIRQNIIDSLINKFQLEEKTVETKKSSMNGNVVNAGDITTANTEVIKRLNLSKDDDESSSGEFYGFSDNDNLNSKWTNPDVLATPIAPNPNKSVFISEDLDNFMRENALDNITSCHVPNIFEYKPLIEGMVCDGSQPPMLCLPPRIDNYAQKPRTLAEKRLLFKKKKDVRFLMMENQSSTYHAFTKRLKTNHIDRAVIESIQNQNVPFDRNCWQLISWLNTDYLKFYFQVLNVDGDIFKLIGGRGGYTRKDFSRMQSSMPFEKLQNEPCPHNEICKKFPPSLKITVYNPDLNEKMIQEASPASVDNVENNSIRLLYHKYENIDLKKMSPGPLSKKCKKLNTIKDPDCNGDVEPYRIPRVELEVWPKINCPLDQSVRPYLKMILPHTNITNDWAKFAVSTVQCKNLDNEQAMRDANISHTFVIPYENDQKCIIVRRIKTNQIDAMDDDTMDLAPYQEFENKNLDDFLQYSELNFLKTINKDDQIDVDCGSVLEDIINSVTITMCEDLFIKNDPDINYNKANEKVNDGNSTNNNTNVVNKSKVRNGKTKMLSELRKLNATIINASDDSVDSNSVPCDNDFCKMGCVCSSLARRQNSKNRHCKNLDCIFQCKCLAKGNMSIKDDLTMEDLRYLREKATESLAKEEKEFSSTIIVKNNNTIILQDPKKDGKRSKKAPKRFSDYQFINDNGVKFSYEIIKNENNQCDKVVKTRVGDNTNDGNKLDEKTMRNNRKYVKLNLKNAMHCSVRLRRLNWLEDLEPWCMVHCLYKCFCQCEVLHGEPFSLTESITGVAVGQTVTVPTITTTTDKDLFINTTIPRIRNFTFDSNTPVKPEKQKVGRKPNSLKAAAAAAAASASASSTKQVSVKRQSSARSEQLVAKRSRVLPTKKIPIEPVKIELPPPPPTVTVKEDPVKIENQLETPCNDNLAAARLRKVATEYYIQRNRARRASVYKSISRNNTDNLKLILQEKIQTAIKYDTGNRSRKNRKNDGECESRMSIGSESTIVETSNSSDTLSEEPIYISVDLNNIGNKKKTLLKTRNSEDSVASVTSVASMISTPQVIEKKPIKNEEEVESKDVGKMTVTTSKSTSIQDMFITRFNNKVSLVMQRICDLLRHNVDFNDMPERNVMNFIKWEHLINLYKNDQIFIWLISTFNTHTLALTTVQCVPVAGKSSMIVNIKAVHPRKFPLLAKLISLKIMTPKMMQLGVILYGCENYWRINGIFNTEKELNGSFVVKPTTVTHPNLASKIMRVRNLIALQQQLGNVSELLQPQSQTQSQTQTQTQAQSKNQNQQKIQNLLEEQKNSRKYLIASQKLKSNVKLVPLAKEELDSMCVPIRIDRAHRWLVLSIYNDFTAIYLPSRKCFIKHNVIMATIKLAQEKDKFVRINNISRKVPDIYGIPKSKNKIFLGPYDLYTDVDIVLCDTFNGEIVTRENYENQLNKKFSYHTFGAWLTLDKGNFCAIQRCFENNVEQRYGNQCHVVYHLEQDDDCIIIEDSSDNSMNMPIVIDDDDEGDDALMQNDCDNEENVKDKEVGGNCIGVGDGEYRVIRCENIYETKADKDASASVESVVDLQPFPGDIRQAMDHTETVLDKTIKNAPSEEPSQANTSSKQLLMMEPCTVLKMRRKMMMQHNGKQLPFFQMVNQQQSAPEQQHEQRDPMSNLKQKLGQSEPTHLFKASPSGKLGAGVTYQFPPPLTSFIKTIAEPIVAPTPPIVIVATASNRMATVTTKRPVPPLKPVFPGNLPDFVTIRKKLPSSTSVYVEKNVNDVVTTEALCEPSTVIDLTAINEGNTVDGHTLRAESPYDPFKIIRTGPFAFHILDSDLANNDGAVTPEEKQQPDVNVKVPTKRNSLQVEINAIPRKLMKFSRKSLPNTIVMDDMMELEAPPRQQQPPPHQQKITGKKNNNNKLAKDLPPKLLMLSVKRKSLDTINDDREIKTKKSDCDDVDSGTGVDAGNDPGDNILNKEIIPLVKVCDKSLLKNNLYTKPSSMSPGTTISLLPVTTASTIVQPIKSRTPEPQTLLSVNKRKSPTCIGGSDCGMDNESKKLKTLEYSVDGKKMSDRPANIVAMMRAIDDDATPPIIGVTTITKIKSPQVASIKENNKLGTAEVMHVPVAPGSPDMGPAQKDTEEQGSSNVIEILSDEEPTAIKPLIRINQNKFQPNGYLICNVKQLGCIPTNKQPNDSFVLKLPKMMSVFKLQHIDAVNNYLNKYIRQHVYGVLVRKASFTLKWHFEKINPNLKYYVMNEFTLNSDMVLTQYGLINLTEYLEPSLKKCFVENNLYIKYLLYKLGHVLISPTELRESNILEIIKLAVEEIKKLSWKALRFEAEQNVLLQRKKKLILRIAELKNDQEGSGDAMKMVKRPRISIEARLNCADGGGAGAGIDEESLQGDSKKRPLVAKIDSECVSSNISDVTSQPFPVIIENAQRTDRNSISDNIVIIIDDD